jgi:uncharacterized protein YqeY
MSLSDKINEDLKQAMKEQAKDRLEALRAVKTAFILARTEKGAEYVLTPEEELKIIQRLVKQRKESAEIFDQQNRPDLASKELMESEVISAYLPAQMSDREIEAFIKEIISKTGASGMKDMGKVMGLASRDLAGKADGKKISEIVRKSLGS